MGVSVGGQLTPDLIAHYPDDFRAAVSVNGMYHPDSLARVSNQPFNDPRVSRAFYSAMMYEVTSPLAPEAFRRESQWIYSSNAPGLYKGDTEFYAHGHDLRLNGHLIDTKRTPLFALVGELDPVLGLPGGPQEIPENIPGARFEVLQGLSHFAMSDDPVRFNAAIKPILAEAEAAAEPAGVVR
jgi:pimeloyl-ACP methyl ester carboxylesterase